MTAIDTSPKALRKLAKSARKLNTLTLGSSGWGAHLAAVLGAIADEKEAQNGPLTYRSYLCTPDHAVQCAYLLSLAEAEYARDPASDAAEIIELYARGDASMDEAIDALQPPDEEETDNV